jgi:PadR family transcriptional regulator PadR
MKKRTNPDFLNGVPELLILRLLSEQPMHGYDLVQRIRLSTAGVLEFGEGCIYPLLHRLEAQGLLASQRRVVGGRNRVVYSASAKGRKRLSQTEANWRETVAAVAKILEGGPHGRPAMA